MFNNKNNKIKKLLLNNQTLIITKKTNEIYINLNDKIHLKKFHLLEIHTNTKIFNYISLKSKKKKFVFSFIYLFIYFLFVLFLFLVNSTSEQNETILEIFTFLSILEVNRYFLISKGSGYQLYGIYLSREIVATVHKFRALCEMDIYLGLHLHYFHNFLGLSIDLFIFFI